MSFGCNRNTNLGRERIVTTPGGNLASWPYNNDTLDVSGNDNHGTNVNNCFSLEDEEGNPLSAYKFNGLDQYITCMGTQPFPQSGTIVMNMLLNQWVSYDNFFTNSISTKSNQFRVEWRTNGTFVFYSADASGAGFNMIGTHIFTTGNYFKFSCTWKSGNGVDVLGYLKVYVNDNLVDSVSHLNISAPTNFVNFGIGRGYFASRTLGGIIDYVDFYDYDIYL